MAKEFLNGATAVARTVALCRPGVVCAYPITPQTHIVEELASIVADGKLDAEFVNAESEHSAASCVLGAAARGVRAYTASSSQGLLLMAEVIFNIAGLRLPVVMCCVNRAVSGPINIWNDQQDIMVVRDSGAILLFAETIQEACDLHIQAFSVAENNDVMLPVIVNIDGFLLSHGYELVELPEQTEVDDFLPPYNPPYKLDPDEPLTFGSMVGPPWYMETRYAMQKTMEDAIGIIQDTAVEFTRKFNRISHGIFEKYSADDAEIVFLAMGSVCGTIKEAVDELRNSGEKVGLIKLILYRPFPKTQLYDTLKNYKKICVVEKAISLGLGGPVANELRAVFHNYQNDVRIDNYILGLGGRDISKDDIFKIYEIAKSTTETIDLEFINIKPENIGKFI